MVDELDRNDGTRDGYIDLTRDGPTSLWERTMIFLGLTSDGFHAPTLRDLFRIGDAVASHDRITRAGAQQDGTPIVELTQGVDGLTLGLR